MKKSLIIISIALIILLLFSLWGERQGSPEITPQKAVDTVSERLDEKTIETIKNLDSPEVEEIVFNKKPSIYFLEENTHIIGRKLYKITFNTTQDGLLGPIVFYVDKSNGEIIGMGFRG